MTPERRMIDTLAEVLEGQHPDAPVRVIDLARTLVILSLVLARLEPPE